MESASVTVSDIIDVLSIPSSRRTKETNGQLPVQSSIDAILVERATNDSEALINLQSLGTITGEESTIGRGSSQHLCHRLCYHQSGDLTTEIPVSFLSQRIFNVASLGRSVTLDDFVSGRSSDFGGESVEKEKRRWRTTLDEWQIPSNDSSHELPSSSSSSSSSSPDLIVDSDPCSPVFTRWKSFLNEMGTLASTQGGYPSHDWDLNGKTNPEEDLDDSPDWLRRPPIRNRFDTGSRCKATTVDCDTGVTHGSGVSSATRKPRKYFLKDEMEELDQPRRQRINFRLLAAQLFRPKRSTVSVAPKVVYDPNVYAFPSPLSEELGCLDLVALSREGRDWRTVTDSRPKDPTEEKILDRLLHIKRLEDETVEAENAEKAARGSQCRTYEHLLPPRRAKSSSAGFPGGGVRDGGRSQLRLVRGRLEAQVNRLSMERSCGGLERSTRLRRTDLKDDPNGTRPQKRLTLKKPQLDRPRVSDQSESRVILATIQPDCEELVQVKGHQLTSDLQVKGHQLTSDPFPEDKANQREVASGFSLKAGHSKPDTLRATVPASCKTHTSLPSVTFAEPLKLPRSSKQKCSSSTASTETTTITTTTTTTKPSSSSSSKKRRQSPKKRPRTAV